MTYVLPFPIEFFVPLYATFIADCFGPFLPTVCIVLTFVQAVVLSAVNLTSLKKVKFRRGASVTLVLKNGESSEYAIPQVSSSLSLATGGESFFRVSGCARLILFVLFL